MSILNLTNHLTSPEQIAAGVVDLPASDRAVLARLLTFDTLPDREMLFARAGHVGDFASLRGFDTAMIGGAPFFMAYLEVGLRARGIDAVYAFSRRESVEETVDGKVIKRSVFVHAGFVPAR